MNHKKKYKVVNFVWPHALSGHIIIIKMYYWAK